MRRTNRIDYIDCAKGIGILLVIIGHTVTNDSEAVHQAIRGGIFSFHMPMFFMLSCMTYRLSADRDQFVRKIEKAFRHLIIPMHITYAIVILIGVIHTENELELSPLIVQRLSALIYASGVNVNVAGAIISAML